MLLPVANRPPLREYSLTPLAASMKLNWNGTGTELERNWNGAGMAGMELEWLEWNWNGLNGTGMAGMELEWN